MGTQPRPTQMSSVHNITWVLVPLTHSSRDGHKKSIITLRLVLIGALIVWGYTAQVCSLDFLERIWFTRGIVVAVPCLWTVTNQMNISDCCCLILDSVECDKNVTTMAIAVDWFSSVPSSSSSLDQFLSVFPQHKEMIWYNAIHWTLWTLLSKKQRNLTEG